MKYESDLRDEMTFDDGAKNIIKWLHIFLKFIFHQNIKLFLKILNIFLKLIFTINWIYVEKKYIYIIYALFCFMHDLRNIFLHYEDKVEELF